MRIVFMGTPSYATTILKALINDECMEVVLLVTQEDKPVGRKQILTPPDTKAWLKSEAFDMEVYQPKTLRAKEAWDTIARYRPDFIVVAAYGKLLPKEVLEIAPCINLHASLLPLYRGASPIQSTLLNSHHYAGVTSMRMEEGLDTGDMLGFFYHKVKEAENAESLFTLLAKKAADLTLLTLKNFKHIKPLKQLNADASHCKKIKKEDGEVNFEQSASEIKARHKALTPWPGIFLGSGLKLLDIEVKETLLSQSSGLIESLSKEGVVITCQNQSVLIQNVQPASKNAMKAVDYIRGKRLSIGDRLV